MSHKGVRHHLVSQSHHHRWASRRSVTHLQHHLRACRPVPTSAHHSSRSRVSHHNPTPKPSTRGSFDAFIAAEKSPQTISRGSFDAFIASQKPNSEQSQSSNQNVLQNLTEPGDQRLIHPYFADLGLPQGSLHNSLMYHVLQLKIATMIYNKVSYFTTNQPTNQPQSQQFLSSPHCLFRDIIPFSIFIYLIFVHSCQLFLH